MEHLEADLPEPDLPTFRQVHGGHGRDDLKRRPEGFRVGQAVAVQRMDGDLGAGMLGHGRVVADVIPVTMTGDDQLQRPVALSEFLGDPGQSPG